MKAVVVIGLLLATCSVAIAQNSATPSTGSAAGQTSTSSSSVNGTAGTNVGGTVQTNQGNSYGNNATGAPTQGMSRTGQPATYDNEKKSSK
jgi:hypothetical protein